MAALLERLRRYSWIDSLAKSVEAYTSLTEQYPWIKTAWTVFKWAGAAVLALWTYLAESWLPMALFTGIGTYVALSFLPAAIRAGRLPTAATVKAAKGVDLAAIGRENADQKLQAMDRDLLILLTYSVYLSAVLMLENLLKLAPEGIREPIRIDLVSQKQAESEKFLEIVRRKMDPGSWRRSNFENVMNDAMRSAESHLEQMPLSVRPPGVDPLVLRRHAISYLQCARAITFLQHEKRDVEENLLRQRSDLLAQYRLRNPG
jgi:hypothetical protein